MKNLINDDSELISSDDETDSESDNQPDTVSESEYND